MKTMFYNLAYGALENASTDGVAEEWYLYRDQEHREKDNHHLDPPFRSSIYLTNPGNSEWQAYLAARHDDVYRVFNFDGYHIDQLGNRGTVYDYDGNTVDLAASYLPFIAAMKQAQPNKRLVMNAVSGYGQEQIAQSATDILYTEVWDECQSYADLADVIAYNDQPSGGNSVPCWQPTSTTAARQHGLRERPGVLLANAVIFSFGGAHSSWASTTSPTNTFPTTTCR